MNAWQRRQLKVDTILVTEGDILLPNSSNKTECFIYKGEYVNM